MASLPTNLLTQRCDGSQFVYVGQADGTVSLCSISNGGVTVEGSVVLGKSPLSMCVHTIGNADVVVAVGDQAAVLQLRNNQLSQTPIIIKVSFSALSMRKVRITNIALRTVLLPRVFAKENTMNIHWCLHSMTRWS
jgi:hypothetical protein